jgi:hypothetical protein
MVCSADWFAMVESDPRLTRMLARHFPSLQGLRLIAVSVFLQSMAEVWLFTRSQLWTWVGGLGASLLFLSVIAILHRYYIRFGRVVPSSPPRWVFHLFVLFVAIALPLPSFGLPNVVWAVLSAVPLWVAWDCRPYRSYHAATSAAMLYVAFGRVAYPNAGDLAWMAPRMWLFTSVLAVCGVLDHRVFMKAIQSSRVQAAEAS